MSLHLGCCDGCFESSDDVSYIEIHPIDSEEEGFIKNLCTRCLRTHFWCDEHDRPESLYSIPTLEEGAEPLVVGICHWCTRDEILELSDDDVGKMMLLLGNFVPDEDIKSHREVTELTEFVTDERRIILINFHVMLDVMNLTFEEFIHIECAEMCGHRPQ